MVELSASHRLTRLLIVALVCGVYVWGMRFLPQAYQPSRPLYSLAWLVVCGVTYIGLRQHRSFAGSVAGVLSMLFGVVFIATLFMRN